MLFVFLCEIAQNRRQIMLSAHAPGRCKKRQGKRYLSVCPAFFKQGPLERPRAMGQNHRDVFRLVPFVPSAHFDVFFTVCTTMMHYQRKMAGCINPCKWPL